jgi:hypothetical protein
MIEAPENGKLAHAGTGHSLIHIIKAADFKRDSLIVAGVNGAVDSAISAFTDFLKFFVVGLDLHGNEKLNISKKSGKNHFNGCGGNARFSIGS